MITRTFGKTNWNVSTIGFGSWGLGGQWGPVERATAIDTLKAAYDAGVNFFDTADAYGEPPGLNEELLGEALQPVRDRVFIATKVGNFARRAGHPLSFATPLHIELCCDASLYRLKTDVIDVYLCHLGWVKDPSVVVVFNEAFDRLKKKGKIRVGGVSPDSMETLLAFNAAGSCEAVELDYSFLNRAPEKDLLPYCQQNRIGVIVRGPLAMGVAAGKFTKDTQFSDSVRSGWNQGPAREKYLRQLDVMEKLRWLDQPNRTLAQAALQFAVAHEAVSTAIPGAKSPAQARANAAAGRAPMPLDELNRVQQLTA